MNKVRLYPQLELLNTWAIDRTRFSPDATEPPLCLRCGRPAQSRSLSQRPQPVH